MTSSHYDTIIIGAELKPPAQYLEALRAGTRNERSRVEFIRLSRTEARL